MEEMIKLISHIIVNHPAQLKMMLNEDGVVVDATNFTTKELSDATLTGLTTSKKFNNDFVDFAKKMNMSFSSMDGYSNAIGDFTSAIPSLTTLFMANTNTKNLQAQLDAQNKSNETALALKEKDLELAKLGLLASQGGLANVSGGKSGNTTLYIALGIGGALILGLVVFLVTRKK